MTLSATSRLRLFCRARNHALATVSDFFEEFVIAEIFQHPRNRWFKRLVIFVVEQGEAGPKQAHTANSLRGIREHGGPAFCANFAGTYHSGFRPIYRLQLYCRKFFL